MIAAVVTDLIFASRISAQARAAGLNVQLIRTLGALDELLTHASPDLLIVDLNAQGIDPMVAIARTRKCAKLPRICAYFSHVQHELADEAHKLGADEVLPRSRFVNQLRSLFAAYGKTDSPRQGT